MPDSFTLIRHDLRNALAHAGLTSLDDFLANRAGDFLAGHGMTHTRRINLNSGDHVNASPIVGYLKTYDYTRRPLRHRFIRDKARRETQNFNALRQRCGCIVPSVVCHGARRRFGALVKSFILTLEVPSTRPLEQVWADAPLHRAELLQISPAFVARMHAARFIHIDLRWRNLLVVTDPDRPMELVPIDCVRGGLCRSAIALAHGRLRDLSSLYKDARPRMSRSQLLRWYRQYLGALHNLARPPSLDNLQRSVIRAILRDRVSKDAAP